MRCAPALALLLAAIISPAAEPRAHRHLAYVEPPHELQTLDLYAPAGGGPFPLVVWIHGGGWQRGDKSEVDHKAQALVDQGYVFVSINYRLLPEVHINEMAADVARAIRWVYDHASDYGGDRESIVLMGHSAGAQLAALVCTDERYLSTAGLTLKQIKACIPVDGDTYDVPMQIAAVEEQRAKIYQHKFGDEKNQRALSCVSHIALGKDIPPFLILHVAGHPETTAQSGRLATALQQAGVPAALYAAEGKDHVSLNADLGLPDDPPTQVLLRFLRNVCNRPTNDP